MDDLREQLIAALRKGCQSHPCMDKVHEADADRVLPLVVAAVEQAKKDTADHYEYGVLWRRVSDDPHRWGMTEDQARLWIRETEQDGAAEGAFTLIRRPIGAWRPAGGTDG